MNPHPGRDRVLTALILASSLTGAWAGVLRAATGITLGSVAPNFAKTQLAGGSVSLSDYSGKVVLLFLLGYS